ncbi:MAG: hypothetical protein HWE24_17400 [Oceanospirillaceae bacterium]|nr:hypothetical protein [Oceanospirillaceae bacterium]
MSESSSPKSGLRSNFIFALLGNTGYVVFQYLTLAVFVKFYSDAEVGIYHYSNAFVIPLVLTFDLQLRSLFITGSETGNFESYWNYRRYLNVLSIAVVSVVAYFVKTELFWYILSLGFLKVIENQTNLIYGLYHRTEGLKKMATSRWLRSGLSFAAVIVSVLTFKPDFFTLILIYVGAGTAVYLLFDYRWSLSMRRRLKAIPLSYKELIILTIPMFFIAILEKYYINYPRLIIEEYFGLEVIGIVGTLFYLRMMGGQVIIALSTSFQGRYGELLKQNRRREVVKLVFKGVMGGLGIGIAMMGFFAFAGRWVLPILFSDQYADSVHLLLWILAGSTLSFGYTFFGGGMNALRNHRFKIPSQAIAFAVLFVTVYLRHETVEHVLQAVVLSEAVLFAGYFFSFMKGAKRESIR